jgi:hypothetical protein
MPDPDRAAPDPAERAPAPGDRDEAGEDQGQDDPSGASPLVRLATEAPATVGRAAATAVSAVGGVVGAAARRWDERPGARVRRLRRLSRQPLANLYERHPDARNATPREIGVRSVDLDEIAGTAVGGITQRGGDFLPLKPFRSQNWAGRWQRLLRAVDNLTILPPIDLVRYGGRYWVTDGHNRVAAALYVGQVEIDANITELVPPGANPSERPSNLAAALTGTRALRAAGRGGRLTGVDNEIPPLRQDELARERDRHPDDG